MSLPIKLNEFLHFFVKELDNLHETQDLQNFNSTKRKLEHIENHMRSKFLQEPKMKDFFNQAKEKENLNDYLTKLILQQDIYNIDCQALQVTECKWERHYLKCGYQFNQDVKVIKPEEVDPSFLCKYFFIFKCL